jgi:hypothetical protein
MAGADPKIDEGMVTALEAVIRTGDIDDVGVGVSRRSLTSSILARTAINRGYVAVDADMGSYYVTQTGKRFMAQCRERRVGSVVSSARVRVAVAVERDLPGKGGSND